MASHPRLKNTLKVSLLFLVLAAVCSSCGSSVNMHKHKRADCDCPRFD